MTFGNRNIHARRKCDSAAAEIAASDASFMAP